MRKLNIAIDLDGTLAAWRRGEDNGDNRIGDWLPGAREALTALLQEGHRVTVHSCRATWPEGGGVEAIQEFLDEAGFGSVVDIWTGQGKPIAHLYIDDRAVEFNGDWVEVIAEVADYKFSQGRWAPKHAPVAGEVE